MIIVSVGTGTIKQPYHYQDFRNAGELKWLQPIIDILMSGNAETVHYQLSKMFDSLHEDDQKDYHRLEPHLNNASAEMDNVTHKNTYELQQAGLKYIEENEELLRIIAQKLVKTPLNKPVNRDFKPTTIINLKWQRPASARYAAAVPNRPPQRQIQTLRLN